ncbi:MAG: hypothetical protein VCG02_09855 [Verrucomicrobiota bacterium]
MSEEPKPDKPCILYCHCAYAKVVPPEVKKEVLENLAASGVTFEAVADLCELSASKDPALQRLAASPGLRIAACYPRAVEWLFKAADVALPEEGISVHNMRTETAKDITEALLDEVTP